ncbi:MAG TPA: DUF929 family protein, partial [Acidimicrobiales bacterium]|nr:DUF929 family protein [Acidimicrobiales bacterium]
AAVGVVVVIILGFVIFKVANGGTTSSAGIGPTETAIQSSVFTAVTTTPFSLANEVGVPSTDLVSPPKVVPNQPLLKIDGKPAVVFIGALFCPYCAAERWAIVIALSPFGTWSGLRETTSSPYDTDPSTATFAFDHATFTSDYITFVPREAETNDTTALGTRQKYQPLTAQESNLWTKYSSYFGQPAGFPFLDIGNQVFVVTPSYDPQILAGLNQAQIAQKLSNSGDLVTEAIMGTVNYIRAGVCHITGQQPSNVCSQSGVHAAAKAMGLS